MVYVFYFKKVLILIIRVGMIFWVELVLVIIFYEI